MSEAALGKISLAGRCPTNPAASRSKIVMGSGHRPLPDLNRVHPLPPQDVLDE